MKWPVYKKRRGANQKCTEVHSSQWFWLFLKPNCSELIQGHNYSERCPLQWVSLISDKDLSAATHSTSYYRGSELHEVCKLCEWMRCVNCVNEWGVRNAWVAQASCMCECMSCVSEVHEWVRALAMTSPQQMMPFITESFAPFLHWQTCYLRYWQMCK